ncbi:MAG TPA: response regulator [Bryobacteraceae bacterium]|nr:response regulator [Bryobacteraceae bacterium]
MLTEPMTQDNRALDQPQGVIVDLLTLLLLSLAAWEISAHLNLFERVYAYVAAHEKYNLDELGIVLLLSPLALVIAACRRWRDLRRQMLTHQRAAEELREAKEAAERASRAKDQFLANMSHEIRTPMNGIVGMTELLLEAPVPPERREYLEAIRNSADSLLTVVNDVLDYSQIEAGRLRFDPQPFSLEQAVRETVQPLAFRAHEKGLEALVDLERDLPEYVDADPYRLRQVLTNLIGNAVKFTSQGEVLLTIGREPSNGPEVLLHFSVADTGMGIPADKCDEIFQPFTQVDGSVTRRHGGTGLGLSICGRLVAQMGGRIWVESELGRGSTFHFTVLFAPAARPEDEAPPPAPEVPAGTRVLIVDDSATSRRILVDLVQRLGCAPEAVDSASAGLEAMRQSARGGRRFDLLLADAAMPGVSGFSLIERIQQDPALAATAIVMLSSADRRVDLEMLRTLGAAAYLVKPVTQAALRVALANGLSTSTRPVPQPGRSPAAMPARVRPLRILLAEDNPVNQTVAAHALRQGGHWVAVAATGKQTLDMLAAAAFDLVLMDLHMPEMDGLTAARRIRENERESGLHMPVIAMTACAMEGDRERCLEAGMDDYLTKPISPHELLAKVAALEVAAAEPRA